MISSKSCKWTGDVRAGQLQRVNAVLYSLVVAEIFHTIAISAILGITMRLGQLQALSLLYCSIYKCSVLISYSDSRVTRSNQPDQPTERNLINFPPELIYEMFYFQAFCRKSPDPLLMHPLCFHHVSWLLHSFCIPLNTL